MYLTPKQCVGQQCGEWIEIAYGTNRGMVRIIFQHPETVGQGKLTNLTVFYRNFSFNNKLSIYSICKKFFIFNVIKIVTSYTPVAPPGATFRYGTALKPITEITELISALSVVLRNLRCYTVFVNLKSLYTFVLGSDIRSI